MRKLIQMTFISLLCISIFAFALNVLSAQTEQEPVQVVTYQHQLNMQAMTEDMFTQLEGEEDTQEVASQEEGNTKSQAFFESMFKLMGAEYEEAGQTADNELASGKSGYQSHLYFGKNRAFGEGESAPMPQPMQAIAQDLPQVYTLQDKQANEYHMLYEDKESPYRTSQPLINKGKLEKLPGEKTILGYSCRQARWTPDNSASSYLIWYAPELPAGFSPVGYLPVEGLVLEVKDQFVEITAVDMEAGSWPEAMKNFSQYELISSSELAKRMFKTMQATPAMQKLIEEAQKLKENDE